MGLGGFSAVNLALSHRPGWRNGRRTALKMRRGRPREGSNPSPGTRQNPSLESVGFRLD